MPVHELLADAVAGIEPTVKGHRLANGSLVEFEYGLVGRFGAVIRDGHGCGLEPRLVCIPDLNDVAVSGNVRELENVGTCGQDVAGNGDGFAESDRGGFIPIVGMGGCAEDSAEGGRAKRKYKCVDDSHRATLSSGLAGARSWVKAGA